MNKLLSTIFIGLSIFFNLASAQSSIQSQSQADSLIAIWNNTNKPDSVRYDAIDDAIKFIKFTDVTHARKLLKDKLSYALKTNNRAMEASVYHYQGSILLDIELLDSAEHYYRKAIAIRSVIDDQKGLAASTINTGIVVSEKGDLLRAMELYNKGADISEKIGEKKYLSNAYMNIGIIYSTLNLNDNAKSYYKKALAIQKEIDFKFGMSQMLHNIGVSFENEGNLDSAFYYYSQSMEVKQEIGYENGVANSYSSLGSICSKKGNFKKAREFFNKGLALKEKIGIKSGLAVLTNNLAVIARMEGDFDEALRLSKESLEMAKKGGRTYRVQDCLENLYKSYKSIGNIPKAFETFEEYVAVRDSLISVDNQKSTINAEYQHKYEKQKAIDEAQHQSALALEKQKKEKQQIITYATFGGAGILGIFLIFVINRLKITRKQKSIIEETNDELNQQNEEIAAQRDEIEIQKSAVEEAHHEIKESINYAKRIQTAILPPKDLINQCLPNSFVLYLPKDVVAGDFYWLEKVGNLILFAAADCTGHGVPGAMVSVVCHNALNRTVREHKQVRPDLILNKTRELVLEELAKSKEDIKDGMDIALCSLEGNKLNYAGAHNPLWIIRNGEILEQKGDKQPIGKFDHAIPFKNHEIELQTGDTIYLFSDGFADQFGGDYDKKFGSRRLKELLISIQAKSMSDQQIMLNDALQNWMKKGQVEQLDDICFIGIKT